MTVDVPTEALRVLMRKHRPARFGALLLAVLWTFAFPAFGQSKSAFELTWTAPAPCRGEAAIRKQIATLAASPLAREAPLQVRGKVTEHDGRFVLQLEVRDGKLVGRREFQADTCDEVIGAGAVIVALLLNTPQDAALELKEAPDESTSDSAQSGQEGSRSQPPPASAKSETRSAAQSRGRATPAPSPETQPSRGNFFKPRYFLSVPVLNVGLFALSTANLGAGLGFGMQVERLQVSVYGVWNLTTRLKRASSPGQGADVARQAVLAAGCRWFLDGRFKVAPCFTLSLERLSARGVGTDVLSRRQVMFWLAPGARLLGRAEVMEDVAFWGGAGLQVHATRPILEIEGLGELEQIGAAELTVIVGADWIF